MVWVELNAVKAELIVAFDKCNKLQPSYFAAALTRCKQPAAHSSRHVWEHMSPAEPPQGRNVA